MQKYSGQQWCRDISESGPTVARQWPDSARQGPTPRQSGLKDTGPAVRHVRHPRHLRHARHSDTRHSDTLRHDARVSTVQPPSDTGQTQARHLRHRRHQCQSTPLRHCSDTTPTPPTPPTLRHIRAQALALLLQGCPREVRSLLAGEYYVASTCFNIYVHPG